MWTVYRRRYGEGLYSGRIASAQSSDSKLRLSRTSALHDSFSSGIRKTYLMSEYVVENTTVNLETRRHVSLHVYDVPAKIYTNPRISTHRALRRNASSRSAMKSHGYSSPLIRSSCRRVGAVPPSSQSEIYERPTRARNR